LAEEASCALLHANHEHNYAWVGDFMQWCMRAATIMLPWIWNLWCTNEEGILYIQSKLIKELHSAEGVTGSEPP